MNARAPLTLPLLLLCVSSCGGGPDTSQPPVVHWGEDVCARCSMIVSEERFAAALWEDTERGAEPRVFDDVGCLVEYLGKTPPPPRPGMWVHAYEGSAWLPAGRAFYVRSKRLETPMGYGVVAVRDRGEADELARRSGGEVLSWKELTASSPR